MFQVITLLSPKGIGQKTRKRIELLVNLRKIKDFELLRPLKLKAVLEWSLSKTCQGTDISCPYLDPRSVTVGNKVSEEIQFPDIFFQTGRIRCYTAALP